MDTTEPPDAATVTAAVVELSNPTTAEATAWAEGILGAVERYVAAAGPEAGAAYLVRLAGSVSLALSRDAPAGVTRMPALTDDAGAGVAGLTKVQCSRCERTAHVPSDLLAARPNAVVVCQHCAADLGAEAPPADVDATCSVCGATFSAKLSADQAIAVAMMTGHGVGVMVSGKCAACR